MEQKIPNPTPSNEPPELSASKALTTIQDDVRRVKSLSLADVKEYANIMCGAGFFPKAIKNPEALMAIMLMGKEMGLPPMLSVTNLFVPEGSNRVSSDTKTMLAVIYRSGFLENIEISDNSQEVKKVEELKVSVTMKRVGFSPFNVTTTWQDAVRANLTSKDNWKTY